MSVSEIDILDLRDKLLSEVRIKLSKPSFDTWFCDLDIKSIEVGKNIVFEASSNFSREWLETRYTPLVTSLLKQITTCEYTVSFVASDKPRHPASFITSNISSKHETLTVTEIIYHILKLDSRERDKLLEILLQERDIRV